MCPRQRARVEERPFGASPRRQQTFQDNRVYGWIFTLARVPAATATVIYLMSRASGRPDGAERPGVGGRSTKPRQKSLEASTHCFREDKGGPGEKLCRKTMVLSSAPVLPRYPFLLLRSLRPRLRPAPRGLDENVTQYDSRRYLPCRPMFLVVAERHPRISLGCLAGGR